MWCSYMAAGCFFNEKILLRKGQPLSVQYISQLVSHITKDCRTIDDTSAWKTSSQSKTCLFATTAYKWKMTGSFESFTSAVSFAGSFLAVHQILGAHKERLLNSILGASNARKLLQDGDEGAKADETILDLISSAVSIILCAGYASSMTFLQDDVFLGTCGLSRLMFAFHGMWKYISNHLFFRLPFFRLNSRGLYVVWLCRSISVFKRSEHDKRDLCASPHNAFRPCVDSSCSKGSLLWVLGRSLWRH